MIVGYFDIVGMSARPAKANAVLVINPNRVLTFSIALQLLQLVARRRLQVMKAGRRLDHEKLAPGNTLHAAPAPVATGATEEGLCLPVAHGLDQQAIGRASCRERVCMSQQVPGVTVPKKKKKND